MLFMFLMIFGSALWFLSDGYLMWPKEAKRYQTFSRIADELIADGRAKEKKDEAVTKAWEAYAKENDLPAKVPKDRTAGDLKEQRVIGFVMLAGAMVYAAWVAWNHRRSVRADGDIVTGPSGEKVHFDSIVDMDRRKWASKGIAYAIYEKNGKQCRLTLDDHKFLGCEAIILEAERRMKERAAATAEKTAPSEA